MTGTFEEESKKKIDLAKNQNETRGATPMSEMSNNVSPMFLQSRLSRHNVSTNMKSPNNDLMQIMPAIQIETQVKTTKNNNNGVDGANKANTNESKELKMQRLNTLMQKYHKEPSNEYFKEEFYGALKEEFGKEDKNSPTYGKSFDSALKRRQTQKLKRFQT